MIGYISTHFSEKFQFVTKCMEPNSVYALIVVSIVTQFSGFVVGWFLFAPMFQTVSLFLVQNLYYINYCIWIVVYARLTFESAVLLRGDGCYLS